MYLLSSMFASCCEYSGEMIYHCGPEVKCTVFDLPMWSQLNWGDALAGLLVVLGLVFALSERKRITGDWW